MKKVKILIKLRNLFNITGQNLKPLIKFQILQQIKNLKLHLQFRNLTQISRTLPQFQQLFNLIQFVEAQQINKEQVSSIKKSKRTLKRSY